MYVSPIQTEYSLSHLFFIHRRIERKGHSLCGRLIASGEVPEFIAIVLLKNCSVWRAYVPMVVSTPDSLTFLMT